MGILDDTKKVYGRNSLFHDLWIWSSHNYRGQNEKPPEPAKKKKNNNNLALSESLDMVEGNKEVAMIKLAEYQQMASQGYNKNVKTWEFIPRDLDLSRVDGSPKPIRAIKARALFVPLVPFQTTH